MKIVLVAVVLPILLLLAPPVHAQVGARAAADGDMLVPLGEARRVRVGMTRVEVLYSMQGRPDANLGEDVWVYWDFTVKGQSQSSSKLTAMLVVFAGARVKLIRLTDPESVRRLVAQQRPKQDQPVAVAQR